MLVDEKMQVELCNCKGGTGKKYAPATGEEEAWKQDYEHGADRATLSKKMLTLRNSIKYGKQVNKRTRLRFKGRRVERNSQFKRKETERKNAWFLLFRLPPTKVVALKIGD
ncbi:hypothetical protein VNO77_16442 [Canavalia gladiata]|uniref:Uncharacterized protein n=1 Tax=Canavalia gladiata TaxID=3824 RepID=A0AAN9QPX4_CANGL